MDEQRRAWREAEVLGVDTIWNWDHFFPLYGEPDGPHFEGWIELAAMACEMNRVRFGSLVTWQLGAQHLIVGWVLPRS